MHDSIPRYGRHVLFTLVVFCGGLFAGLTVAGQLALQATAPLALPEWAAFVDSLRYVAVGGVIVGLFGMAALDYLTGKPASS